MSDEIRRLSDELARDPSSLVFLQLGELLRRQGQTDVALKVAVRGLERHPHSAEAHDLLARISADRGEMDRAFDEWDMVLRLAPTHSGARKGLGFVCFRQGRFAEAERYLADAAVRDAEDPSIISALAHVRQRLAGGAAAARPPEHDDVSAASSGVHRHDVTVAAAFAPAGSPADQAHALFIDVLEQSDRTALLLDANGLVMAGSYLDAEGRDIGQEVGAELSGVSEEAGRATRHLDLGDWSAIVFESEAAIVAMAPAGSEGLLVVAAGGGTPLGLVRRLLERTLARARAWLGAGA